jgi:hypothetical protein
MTDGYLAGKSNEQIKAHRENHVNADEDQNGVVVRADPPQGRREQGDEKQKDQPPQIFFHIPPSSAFPKMP